MLKEDEVSAVDAAVILGRHRVTIHKWVRDGTLKARRAGRRRILLLASVLALRARERRIAKLKAGGPPRRRRKVSR